MPEDGRDFGLVSPSDMGLLPSRHHASVKRRASASFDDSEETNRKRPREEVADDAVSDSLRFIDGRSLADHLAQELQCGCCSELVYLPVVVSPCQHFFCGSCCVLWIRNGGTNCPGCRGVSMVVVPSRPVQTMVDVLLRAAPSYARTERERMQADEVYKAGTSLHIPTPREASPEANNQNGEFARPCPNCLPGNPFGWRCPQPIPDPITDPDRAWHLGDGTPPGHVYCGNCENLLAIRAPSTTKCDLCQVSFCGIGVPGRCAAASLNLQQPHGMVDIADLIQSSEVYECFDHNAVEVEFLIDYLTTQRLTPKHIYREIVAHIQSQPRAFAPLIESELFVDIHGVTAGVDPNPDAARSRACRLCATEILLWGLREWWIRERRKGFLDETVINRKDCPDGSGCGRQKDLGKSLSIRADCTSDLLSAHARELNHMIDSDFLDSSAPQRVQDNDIPPQGVADSVRTADSSLHNSSAPDTSQA